MKTKNYLWQFALCCIFALFVACFASCGEDDPVVTPPEKEAPAEVNFTINTSGNEGTGSGDGTTTPVVVNGSNQLNMEISQKSSYTDSDGSVFTCEPKATIKLSSKKDTIIVKDRNLLTDVKNPNVQTKQTGTAPVVYGMKQTFQIGNDQTIDFDFAYEVYTYLNKANKSIEMPYVKTNQATLGHSDAKETRAISQPVISIRPLNNTRSVVVSDTTLYEVSAAFSVDLESKNTNNDATKTINFTVNYVGAVINDTELPDPVKELSRSFIVESGTNSTASPYKANFKQKLGLTVDETSRYTDSYGNKTECNPKVKISLAAKVDTVCVKDKESLMAEFKLENADFMAMGSDGVTYACMPKIKQGDNQSIEAQLSYQAALGVDVNDESIDMPYLKISSVKLGKLTMSERDKVTIHGADAVCYEIDQPISLVLESVNLPEKTTETVECVVTYIGAVVEDKPEPPTLVKTEYRKDWEWDESPVEGSSSVAAIQFIVYRDRIYSDGTVETDTIRSRGNSVNLEPDLGIHFPPDDMECIPGVLEPVGNNTMLCTETIVVDDISKLYIEEELSNHPEDYADFKNYNKYVSTQMYSETDGWFHKSLTYYHTENFGFRNEQNPWGYTLILFRTIHRFYDVFLYIDGQIISFMDTLPEYTLVQHTIEDIPASAEYGPGKKVTLIDKINYFGHDFYCKDILYVYQRK